MSDPEIINEFIGSQFEHYEKLRQKEEEEE